MPDIGRMISHYRILSRIGGGGMGIVYKAEDTRLRRPVALKFLQEAFSRDREKIERFKREARAASALNHPGIVTIYEIDEVDGACFMAMEYIEGRTLQEAISSGDLTLDQILDYGIQISDALSRAHAAGIVHRDVKPSNLMITKENLAKVLDFGLAKLEDRKAGFEEDGSTVSTADSTTEGKVFGTLSYMSPEQARGGTVDHRTDIFSLGIVLYQMIARDPPFSGPHAAAVLDKLLHSPAPPLRNTVPQIPAALDQTISRALAKNAGERYQSMREMARDLRSIRSGQEPVPRSSKRGRTRTLALALTAILLVLLAVTVFFTGMPSRPGGPAHQKEMRLAVLPFTNVGRDPENLYICDALMSRLASKFDQIRSFRDVLDLVPFSEMISEEVASAAQARDIFGADMVFAGSVQKRRDILILDINLIDAVHLRQIDSATCSALAGDLMTLENEAFEKAVSMLDLQLSPEDEQLLAAGETMHPAAHYAYMNGVGRLLRFDIAENVDSAVGFFRQALREDGMYALAHAGLGEACWRKFESTQDPKWAREALDSCTLAAQLDSRVPRVHMTLGMVYQGTGEPEKAVRALNQAITMDPGSAESHRLLGRAYTAMNRMQDAEASFLRAVALGPDSWSMYWDLGVFLKKQARYGQAAAQFLKVIELEPDSYRAYASLGGIYLYLGEFERAGDVFNRSLAIAESPQAYSNLAASYILQGRSESAVPLLEKAALMQGAGHDVWGNLAEAYSQTESLSGKAAAAYERAAELASRYLEVNPDKADTRVRLAFYCIKLGRRERALEEVARIRGLAQEDPEVPFRTALVYELAGAREKALEALAQAMDQGFSQALIEAASDLARLRRDRGYRDLLDRQSPR
ncbi:MAG: protein kinase [Acidobacteria bacterium]|nr:protein kinase [Acidobacteriota bacterium]